MLSWIDKKAILQLIIIASILVASLGVVNLRPYAQSDQPETPDAVDTYSVYIPRIIQDYPWESPFGIESTSPLLATNTLLQRAADLQPGMARMGNQISWRELQPSQGGPIAWELLATFEEELRGMKELGIRPLVIIKDSPDWALDWAKNNKLLPCGPIAADKFDAFAAFVQQVVNRYKTDEFNVHDWELGNEPDVDPDIAPNPESFGCWGDIDDKNYYGGMHYGEMLKVVTPAIRQVDSQARVWIGGLLLDKPVTPNPDDVGYPERFFKGILQAGAAPYFDVVAYHRYAHYFDYFYPAGTSYDYDLSVPPNFPPNPWESWGGGVIGKARYLRNVMAEYGITKPVVLNETGFGCIDRQESGDYCETTPDDYFYESQATHLVRYFIRAWSENIGGFYWYTLNGPGWRNSGLLDAAQQPRKVYIAYQHLSQKLRYARYLNPVDYGTGVEAYAFRVSSQRVHVVWAIEDQSLNIFLPTNKFIEVTDRYGNPLYDQLNPPPQSGTDYVIQVGFEPILITRTP
jgi:hypothetical protein